jgi:hypothetical protein
MYDPASQRLGQAWDGRPGASPTTTFWHYETLGKEFVIVKCGDDDFRAFTPIDLQGLVSYLGPPPIATSK